MALLGRVLVPVAVALGLARPLVAQAEPRASAAEIKAAYLLNFARYVVWPPGTFDSAAAPLVICVVESDAIGEALTRAAEGRTVNGRPVQVRLVRSSEDPVTCHVAYMDPSAGRLARSLQAMWGDFPVLTVGEGEEFLASGGIIGFVPVQQTVRFAISQEAARRARLQVSSRVLALAVRR